MDDDNADWMNAADDDPVAEAAPEPAAAAAAEGAGPGAEGGEDAAAEGVPVAEDEPHQFLDPDKLLLCKHWVRPRFLQYAYMYDYRRNYYDDVIDYLNKRQKGLSRDIPRPQTWAERTLRTYNSKFRRSEAKTRQDEDIKLLSNIQFSNHFHVYHSREYINRRYSSLL